MTQNQMQKEFQKWMRERKTTPKKRSKWKRSNGSQFLEDKVDWAELYADKTGNESEIVA